MLDEQQKEKVEEKNLVRGTINAISSFIHKILKIIWFIIDVLTPFT